jgi:hypothetical protein
MGAHPGCLVNPGLKGVEPYREDYEFQEEEQAASEEGNRLDAWIKHWVLDCPSHDDYLRKLGQEDCISEGTSDPRIMEG